MYVHPFSSRARTRENKTKGRTCQKKTGSWGLLSFSDNHAVCRRINMRRTRSSCWTWTASVFPPSAITKKNSTTTCLLSPQAHSFYSANFARLRSTTMPAYSLRAQALLTVASTACRPGSHRLFFSSPSYSLQLLNARRIQRSRL